MSRSIAKAQRTTCPYCKTRNVSYQNRRSTFTLIDVHRLKNGKLCGPYTFSPTPIADIAKQYIRKTEPTKKGIKDEKSSKKSRI